MTGTVNSHPYEGRAMSPPRREIDLTFRRSASAPATVRTGLAQPSPSTSRDGGRASTMIVPARTGAGARPALGATGWDVYAQVAGSPLLPTGR